MLDDKGSSEGTSSFISLTSTGATEMGHCVVGAADDIGKGTLGNKSMEDGGGANWAMLRGSFGRAVGWMTTEVEACSGLIPTGSCMDCTAWAALMEPTRDLLESLAVGDHAMWFVSSSSSSHFLLSRLLDGGWSWLLLAKKQRGIFIS